MRKLTIALALVALTTAACKKTGEGEYQVQTPDVDVNRDTTTVRTPTVDVRRDTVQLEVPKVDVKSPRDTSRR